MLLPMPLMGRYAFLVFVLVLQGCSGFAKGITEAVLEKGQSADTRECFVTGPPSTGLEQYLVQQKDRRDQGRPGGTLRILMVHGIGDHLPGYSARFIGNLNRELGLNVIGGQTKTISLRKEPNDETSLGELRISRFFDKAESRELLFYELTWSPITAEAKSLVDFDNSVEFTHRRSRVNARLKTFMNTRIPDSLIYLGEARGQILDAVDQSVCWMGLGDWEDYPQRYQGDCASVQEGDRIDMANHELAFVTHSLGSRVLIDAFLRHAAMRDTSIGKRVFKVTSVMREKDIKVYMLANQLPLLQTALPAPQVVDRIHEFCRPEGAHFEERILGQLSIYAFSDPNDILSYAIPPDFVKDFIDSRLCPEVTNVIINVAQPRTYFGIVEFTNPITAHIDYDDDQRIIDIIAHGVRRTEEREDLEGSTSENSDLEGEAECDWTEVRQ
jgi:hypothetical protein